MSAAAQPARLPVEAPTPVPARPSVRPLVVRWLKITASVGLLLAGAYGVFSEHEFIASSDALVSAYVVSIRTPIEGTVSGVSMTQGGNVRRGMVLGQVENARVDQQRIQTLRETEEEARLGAEALTSEVAALEGQRRDMLSRAQSHASGVSTRLHLQTMEAERLLAGKRAALDQATADLRRANLLHESGIVSNVDLERAQTQFDMAVHDEAAQRANLLAVRTEADAAAQGVMIEPGVNDSVYSRQRADELNLHLIETRRALANLQAQANLAEADMEKETRRTDLMGHADMVSPISGVVWKVEAANGEQVAAGDSVAQIVDCGEQFVLVEVPQERVPDIVFGGRARLRLSGESAERAGRVLSVVEDPKKEGDRKLAALPAASSADARATVRLGFESGGADKDAGQQRCEIGRTARVLLPTNGRSLIARWYRHFF